jgi:hypothetical protein
MDDRGSRHTLRSNHNLAILSCQTVAQDVMNNAVAHSVTKGCPLLPRNLVLFHSQQTTRPPVLPSGVYRYCLLTVHRRYESIVSA